MTANIEMKMQHGGLIHRFENTMRDLYNEIVRNRAERAAHLAPNDLLLLRSIEAAVVYTSSTYENQWKVCLTEVTAGYLTSMEEILARNYCQTDKDFTGTDNYLSIIDAQIIYEHTQDFINFLVAEFDASQYRPKYSFVAHISKYITKLHRPVQEQRNNVEPLIPANIKSMGIAKQN